MIRAGRVNATLQFVETKRNFGSLSVAFTFSLQPCKKIRKSFCIIDKIKYNNSHDGKSRKGIKEWKETAMTR